MANPNIQKLNRIAEKKSRLLIGLMSGTSLDGLDIALCRISGCGTETKVKVLKFATVPYDPKTKQQIIKVFAQPTVDFLSLSELNVLLAKKHAAYVIKCLQKWRISKGRIDLIASHGQTVFHSPKSGNHDATINSTFQIGDGDHLAVNTGIITISDFRQKHVAAGGEGAPLAVYGDYLLFAKKNEDHLLLNIGGIANFTYLPRSGNPSRLFVTDTGPGNTLIDQTMRRFFEGRDFDRDARVARSGSVNQELLDRLKAHSFFHQPFPKTTGPELFNNSFLDKAMKDCGDSISKNDIVATLTRFTAETIAQAVKKCVPSGKIKIYVSGGGAHNPQMMEWIAQLLPKSSIQPMGQLGIDGDAKEAVLFAVLANETVAGAGINFGKRASIPSVSLGKISFPT